MLALMELVAIPTSGDEVISESGANRVSVADSASAIRQAEEAIREAKNVGNLWLGTRDLLAQASALQSSGDNTRATELGNLAETQARLALNQYRLEEARYIYRKLKLIQDHDPDQLRAIDGFLQAYDGAAALHLARKSLGD